MKKNVSFIIMVLFLFAARSFGITFSQWAVQRGLTGNEPALSASNQQITSLSGLAYNYPVLNTLHMDDNLLTVIRPGDFGGLPKLGYLSLRNNTISSVESGGFLGIGSLHTLVLSGNPLTRIDQGDLSGINPMYCYLNWNQISGIEQGSFSHMNQTQALYLSYNKLTSIEQGVFTGLSSLKNLSLGGNQISSLDAGDLDGLSSLEFLGLDGAGLSHIDRDALSNRMTLKNIELNYKHFTRVEQGSFAGLFNLEKLQMWIGDLETIEQGAFRDLTNLKQLYLHSNKITGLSETTFQGLTKLVELTLGSNKITVVQKDLFKGLGALQKLSLNNNNISSFEDMAFADMANLQQLQLNDNPMQILNLKGANLSSLATFNIGNCPIDTVILSQSRFTQASFNVMMTGHATDTRFIGFAEKAGITEMNLSGVDFASITSLQSMFAMDELERLIFANSVHLNGSQVVALLNELNSLCYLDVTGVWNEWNSTIKSNLYAWDALEGNILIIPEPATLLLLGLGGMMLRRKK